MIKIKRCIFSTHSVVTALKTECIDSSLAQDYSLENYVSGSLEG